MNLPKTEDFIALNKSSGYRMIDLVMYKGDEDVEDDNLLSWEITTVSPTLIEIDLTFERPQDVSQGDAYDRLLIQV